MNFTFKLMKNSIVSSNSHMPIDCRQHTIIEMTWPENLTLRSCHYKIIKYVCPLIYDEK